VAVLKVSAKHSVKLPYLSLQAQEEASAYDVVFRNSIVEVKGHDADNSLLTGRVLVLAVWSLELLLWSLRCL
jgi:hypothetical protein